jgi:hypothetical protein
MDCMDGCPDNPLKTSPGVCGCNAPDEETCLADSFAVVRSGDGASGLSFASTATFIELRNLDDGSLVNTFALPLTAVGNNQPLTLSGGANREGTLRLSADGRFLTLAGYAVGPGTANVYLTSSVDTPRVAALIAITPEDGFTVDTSTLFAGDLGPFVGSTGNPANPRAAVTDDGSGFWVVGGGTGDTGGLWYAPFGNPADVQPTQIFTVTGTNQLGAWTCGIFDGQLYGTAKTTTPSLYGVFNVGTALPVTATLPTMLAGNTGSSPLDFAMMDLDPNIAGVDTIYIADEAAPASGGGIQKWIYDGTTWIQAYTLSTGLSGGLRHLLADESPGGIVLLATTAGAANAANTIVKVIDNGADSPFLTLVNAPTNTAFRGISLLPLL